MYVITADRVRIVGYRATPPTSVICTDLNYVEESHVEVGEVEVVWEASVVQVAVHR